MPEKKHIAKIARPRLAEVLPRTRLFRLLDQNMKTPVVWVSGPAGSGKTTLVASWLDARKLPCLWYRLDEGDADIATFFYYFGLAAHKAAPRYKKFPPLPTLKYFPGIPTFTRRFFENICDRLKRPYALVLDNYQDVPETSPFQEMIRLGLSHIPEGITVLVLSRNAPPAHYSDLAVKNSIALLEWEEVRFTADESYALLHLLNRNIPEHALKDIYEKTQGWAAALVLMTGAKASDTMAAGELSREKIFEYFAGEIIDKLDNETKNFLLISSFLPDMTAHNAAQLTGNGHAARILSCLSRHGFFTEKHGAPVTFYRYHPLFREFLVARAKESLDPENIAGLQKQSAALLEEAGQVEDAAELLVEAKDWMSLAGLVLRHAPDLTAQGRSGPIEAWLAAMPQELVENTPWHLYWKGISVFTMNPAASLACLKKSFEKFRALNDVPGVFQAWAGVVDSIACSFEDMHALDDWIESYDALVRENYSVLPSEIASRAACSMFTALVFRQPWRTDLDLWLEKALKHPNVNMRIQVLFFRLIHVAHAGGLAGSGQKTALLHHLSESGHATPFCRITRHLYDTMYFNYTGEYQLSRAAAEAGLALADETGVHVWDLLVLATGAISAFNYDDFAAAARFLSKLPTDPGSLRPWERSYSFYIQALAAFLQCDFRQASDLTEEALKMMDKIGDPSGRFLCRILQVQIMHERGDGARAREFLDRMIEPWRKESKCHDAFVFHLTRAWVYLDHDRATALDSLQKALSTAKEEQLVAALTTWRSSTLCRLSYAALENGIEVDYVKDLIRRRNLLPDKPPLHIENWPWPVKVYTLGRFEIERNGKPLLFAGKVQKKPLELLKALIAFGGEDVSEERLSGALWPEAEGDATHKSFEIALMRLRRLLGNDEAVRLSEGRVSLDRRICWVDVWSFERLISLAESAWKKDEAREKSAGDGGGNESVRNDEAVMLTQKALRMYRGDFLRAEDGHAWAADYRERVQTRFLRLIGRLGRYWVTMKEPEKAIDCFTRGVELDDLVEEFYQHLMMCHYANGRKAEAVKTYYRCRQALSSKLLITPSSKTEYLFKSITS